MNKGNAGGRAESEKREWKDKEFIVKHAKIPVKYPGSDVIVNI